MKQKKRLTDKDIAIGSGIGIGSAIVIPKLGGFINKSAIKSPLPQELAGEGGNITKKILDTAKSRNIPVEHVPASRIGGSPAGYSPHMPGWMKVGEKVQHLGDFGREVAEKLGVTDESTKKLFLSRKEGTILFDPNLVSNRPDIIAHELGHSDYLRKSGKGGLIGKTLHKINSANLVLGHENVNRAGAAVGFISGFKAGMDGKGEEPTWNKYAHLAIPTISGVSSVGSELAASHRGLKELKSLGASKALIKTSKKNLRNALGSYVGMAGIGLVGAVGSRHAGKLAGNYYNKTIEDRDTKLAYENAKLRGKKFSERYYSSKASQKAAREFALDVIGECNGFNTYPKIAQAGKILWKDGGVKGKAMAGGTVLGLTSLTSGMSSLRPRRTDPEFERYLESTGKKKPYKFDPLIIGASTLGAGTAAIASGKASIAIPGAAVGYLASKYGREMYNKYGERIIKKRK